MEPLEQVRLLMTVMHRLAQVMEHEQAVLHSMRLDALLEIQEEKAVLAEAYGIELHRLRRSPEKLAALEPLVRARLEQAMRSFQETLGRNRDSLFYAQTVLDKVMRHIGDSLPRPRRSPGCGACGQADGGRGEIIPVTFDRMLQPHPETC